MNGLSVTYGGHFTHSLTRLLARSINNNNNNNNVFIFKKQLHFSCPRLAKAILGGQIEEKVHGENYNFFTIRKSRIEKKYINSPRPSEYSFPLSTPTEQSTSSFDKIVSDEIISATGNSAYDFFLILWQLTKIQ